MSSQRFLVGFCEEGCRDWPLFNSILGGIIEIIHGSCLFFYALICPYVSQNRIGFARPHVSTDMRCRNEGLCTELLDLSVIWRSRAISIHLYLPVQTSPCLPAPHLEVILGNGGVCTPTQSLSHHSVCLRACVCVCYSAASSQSRSQIFLSLWCQDFSSVRFLKWKSSGTIRAERCQKRKVQSWAKGDRVSGHRTGDGNLKQGGSTEISPHQSETPSHRALRAGLWSLLGAHYVDRSPPWSQG